MLMIGCPDNVKVVAIIINGYLLFTFLHVFQGCRLLHAHSVSYLYFSSFSVFDLQHPRKPVYRQG
jgi:hypothetical protein